MDEPRPGRRPTMMNTGFPAFVCAVVGLAIAHYAGWSSISPPTVFAVAVCVTVFAMLGAWVAWR